MSDLQQARYSEMRWNSPLSVEHADLLLDCLGVGSAGQLLDLGCGWGELLLRAVAAAASHTRGVGVDADAALLVRARDTARTRGLSERVSFVDADITTWSGTADRVLCLGASHAWSGFGQTLTALAAVLAQGGRALVGEGCWERPPTAEAAQLFPEVVPLAELIEIAHGAGWQVVHLSAADQREWDDFEATWRAGRHRWLATHPADPAAAGVREALQTQMREYAAIYRGRLGFAYLVLAQA